MKEINTHGVFACISCWKKNNSNILYVFTAPLPPTPSPSSPKESSAVLAGIPAAHTFYIFRLFLYCIIGWRKLILMECLLVSAVEKKIIVTYCMSSQLLYPPTPSPTSPTETRQFWREFLLVGGGGEKCYSAPSTRPPWVHIGYSILGLHSLFN